MHEDAADYATAHRKPLLLALAAILGVAAYFALTMTGLAPPARAVAGLTVTMALLWITEAIPIPVTSLLPMALLPVLNVMPIRAAAAPYGNEIVFLFLGGFMLQLALERWHLHKRIALAILAHAGTKPARLIGAVMLVTAFLSMWMSNAATTALMLPIAASLCHSVDHGAGEHSHAAKRFGTAIMLGIAYAATLGGLMTPIGTAPNLILRENLAQFDHVDISFFRWMLVGVPVGLVTLVFAWWLLTHVLHPLNRLDVPIDAQGIMRSRRELGPLSRGEIATIAVFAFMITGWLLRQPLCDWLGWVTVKGTKREYWLSDPGIAIIGGIALFCIPVDRRSGTFALDWSLASRIPWGVLLLFGGGLALAEAFVVTGIDKQVGELVGRLQGVHPIVVVLAVAGASVFLSEIASNTALTAMLLPVLRATASGLGISAATLLWPATYGASMAFMLPAGTPPNAIVFGAGRLTVKQMARAGIVLNLFSIVVITLAVWLGAARWLVGG